MIEYYVEIKLVHVAAVIASGCLFFARGAAQLLGATWTMARPLRYVSYAIDTVLLTAALMLAEMLRQYPIASAWVTAKIVLLAVYIVLGSFALKRARSKPVRAWCFVAAVAVFLAIVSIAQTHHPLGFARGIFA